MKEETVATEASKEELLFQLLDSQDKLIGKEIEIEQ